MGPLLKNIGTLGSAGQLIPGIRARLLKPDGTYGGPGEQGELVVYSPSNALRYTNNEQTWVICPQSPHVTHGNLFVSPSTKETFIDGYVAVPPFLLG